MTPPKFVDPPAHARRRPIIDPGTLALIGAIVAVIFIVVIISVIEAGLGFRIEDWFAR